MNILQGLTTSQTYCVTLNDNNRIDPTKICANFNYEHPIYTKEAVIAQQRWGEISGKNRIHYCGAYWGSGFHEDGVNSAIQVCNKLGAKFVA